MNILSLSNHLPVQPSDEHIQRMLNETEHEEPDFTGTGYLYFKKVRIELFDPMSQFSYDLSCKENVVGARCKCSDCGEEFNAGLFNDYGDYKIILTQGIDGTIFPGYAEKNDFDSMLFSIDDLIECPMCGELLRVKSCENFPAYEIEAVRSQQIINVVDITVIITWEHRTVFKKFGLKEETVVPVSAIAIGNDGSLAVYYYDRNKWSCCGPIAADEDIYFDGLQEIYEDSQSINESKIGGFQDTEIPELIGKSGEKTGLADYIAKGGHYPCVYINSWTEMRNMENLVKSQFGGLFIEMFDAAIELNIDYNFFPTYFLTDFSDYFDLNKAKPHEMLGLTKNDFYELCSADFNLEEFKLFIKLMKENHINLQQFKKYYSLYGEKGLRQWKNSACKISLERINNYLQKQGENSSAGIELFCDYYLAVQCLNQQELIFPHNLKKAHEAICEQKTSSSISYEEVVEKYAKLEFTNGELCIVLPRQASDLIAEGKTLRHCVGNYVNRQKEGKSIIFFVRKYRRKERSYYTLNIDFSNGEPKEIQLHGYGNEHHGEKKQYTHQIPQKVRHFVNLWESEILKPWYLEQLRAKASAL